MMRGKPLHAGLVWLLSLFVAQAAMAAGEIEYVLDHTITSVTPVFEQGHEGEQARIQGFHINTDVSVGGAPVGTSNIQVNFLNPPFDLAAPYSHAIMTSKMTLPGIGTVEYTANTVNLTSSTSPTTGDIVFSFSGSFSNGTGGLEGVYGLTSGTGIANAFTEEGTAKQVVRLRWGY